MTAPHDATPEPHRSGAERDDVGRRAPVDDDGTVDRAVSSVRNGIDQVADKVKGLLRSDP